MQHGWARSVSDVSGLVVVMLFAVLVACSGGGNAVSVPPSLMGASGISVRFVIARSVATISKRRNVKFISADTAGVALAFTGSATVSTAVDISPGSAACGGSHASPRTCSSTVAAPPGSYTLTATSYDEAPVAGSIPGGAHKLAAATMSGIVVTAGQANQTTIFLGGYISNLGTTQSYVSLPANKTTQQVGIVLAPTDYDNEAITTSTSAPYANPITLTLTEHSGSGHEIILKNGVSSGTSATLNQATDSVQVQYDGLGSAGYYATVAITASGVTTATLTVSPMYVTPGGGSADASGTVVAFTAPSQTSTLAITEATAPGTVTYSSSLSGCTNVVSASAITGSGASASTVLTALSTIGESCSDTITDSVGASTTVTINVANITYTSIPVQPSTGPYGMALGSDDNVYMTWYNLNKIEKLNTSTNAYTTITGFTGATKLMSTASDGNIYVTEAVANKIAEYNVSSTAVTEYSSGLSTGASPGDIAEGPDGNPWFTETSISDIGTINTSTKAITQYALSGAGTHLCLGPDNQLYITMYSANEIEAFNTSTHTYTPYGGLSSGAGPIGITAGSDGNIWFAENGLSRIGTLNLSSHSVTEYALTSGATPEFVASGPDGNIWFTEGGINKIGMINISTHVVYEFNVGNSGDVSSAFVSYGGKLYGEQLNASLFLITP